jgi:exonuclease VII large subunit
MTELIDLAAVRAARAASKAQEVVLPCDSANTSTIIVSRESEPAQLAGWVDLTQTQLKALEGHGFPTEVYRRILSDEQPMIDEFYDRIPPAVHAYSPQMSESTVNLTRAEYETCRQTMTNLKELAERLAVVVRVVLQIKQTRQLLNTLRSIAPRQFTASNLHGTAEALQPVVDFAANPQTHIERAEALLNLAHTAVVEEHFGDAATHIEQALLVPECLRSVEKAIACGALTEKEQTQS